MFSGGGNILAKKTRPRGRAPSGKVWSTSEGAWVPSGTAQCLLGGSPVYTTDVCRVGEKAGDVGSEAVSKGQAVAADRALIEEDGGKRGVEEGGYSERALVKDLDADSAARPEAQVLVSSKCELSGTAKRHPISIGSETEPDSKKPRAHTDPALTAASLTKDRTAHFPSEIDSAAEILNGNNADLELSRRLVVLHRRLHSSSTYAAAVSELLAW